MQEGESKAALDAKGTSERRFKVHSQGSQVDETLPNRGFGTKFWGGFEEEEAKSTTTHQSRLLTTHHRKYDYQPPPSSPVSHPSSAQHNVQVHRRKSLKASANTPLVEVNSFPNGNMPVQSEELFRQRYAALKNIYQRRLKDLHRCVQDVQVMLQTDSVLQNLERDPTTAPFAPARALEVATGALNAEQEAQIEQLAEELSIVSAQSKSLEVEIAHLEAAQSTQDAKATQTISRLRDQLRSSLESERQVRSHVSDLEEELATVRTARSREFVAMRHALRLLRQALFRSALSSTDQELGNSRTIEQPILLGIHGNAEETSLDESVLNDLAETDGELDLDESVLGPRGDATDTRLAKALTKLTHLHERTKSIQALRSRRDVSSKEQELKLMQEKLIEATSTLKKMESRICQEATQQSSLQDELRQAREALARSEEERLELRQQYLSIGEKLERFAETNRVETQQEVIKFRSRLHEAELEQNRLRQLSDRFQIESKESAMRAERNDRRIEELESKLEHERKFARQELEQERRTFAQKIEAEQSQRKQAQDRLEESRIEHAARLQELREQTQSAVQGAQMERAKWEVEKERQIREYQQRSEANFQRLLDAKQAELENVVKAQQSEIHRQQDETERIERAVASRLHAIVKDHISLEQHREILESHSTNLRAEMDRRLQDTLSQSERKRERALSEVEDRATRVHAASLEAMQQENAVLKAQISQLQREQNELEAALEADRRMTTKLRKESDDALQAKQAHAEQLRQALQNIARLREVVNMERDRRQDAERNHFNAHEAARNSMNTELGEAQQSFTSLQERMHILEREKLASEAALRQELHNLQTKANKAETESAKRISLLESEREKSMSQAVTTTSSEYDKRLTQLQHDYDMYRLQAETQRHQLESQIQSLESARDQSVRDADLVREQLAKRNDDFQEVSRERDQNANQLQDSQRQLKVLRKSTENMEALMKLAQRRRLAQSSGVQNVLSECRQLRSALKPLSRDIYKTLEEGQRDFARFSLELERQIRLDSRRIKRQAMTEAISVSKLEATELTSKLESALQEMETAQEHSNRILAQKDEVIRKHLNQADELKSQLEAYRCDLASAEAKLAGSDQTIAELRSQLLHEKKTLETVQSSMSAKDDRINLLLQKLDRANNALTNLVTVLRSELNIPQETTEDLLDEDRRLSYGIPTLVSIIKKLQKSVASAIAKIADPDAELISQLETSRNLVSSLQLELDVVRKDLRQEIEKHRVVIERLTKTHQEAREEFQRGVERSKRDQVELRNRLQQEKLASKSLREQLASATMAAPRFAPPPPSPSHSLRSGLSCTSAVRSTTDVQRLLERSAIIDHKARSFLSASSETSVIPLKMSSVSSIDNDVDQIDVSQF